MTDSTYLTAAVLLSAVVTWGLRAVPFLFLARLRHNRLLQHLGDVLPLGMMTILVLYTVRDTRIIDPASIVPVATGLATTAGLHLWKNNPLASIGGGTAIYVALASTLPAL